jgi:peptidoglycan biosynthesis protein MviN/MurJ (putative lipid II flippase)
LIFILGLAKLIDLATGVNGQIIGTSNYWRFDFFTNLFYIILSLPLNYILIRNYGLEGLAFSNLIALVIYNSLRFGFLYKKFKLQPYTLKHALFLVLSLLIMGSIHFGLHVENIFWNLFIRSGLYIICFAVMAILINPAPDILDLIKKTVTDKIPALFKQTQK